MNYFVTNAPITFMETSGQIDWVGWGFNAQQISRAVSQGFQQAEGNAIVSIFPIHNQETLANRLDEAENILDSSCYYRMVDESTAIAERDRLKAINDAAEELRKNTPTDEDIFKAQQLLLLTDISLKLGGATNV